MNVRRLSALLACACALAVMLALPAVADAAYTTNTECLSCHDAATGSGAISKVDFTASPGAGNVDYTKCKACHWIDKATYTYGTFNHSHVIGLVFSSGYRLGGPDCRSCHFALVPGTGDLTRVMTTSTPDGFFATATSSRSTSPSQMHAVHVNGSWPRSVAYTTGCASCHESAACTACHTIPPVGHADHTRNAVSGTYAYPPVAYTVGIGTPVTNPGLSTATTMTLTCVNASCHARTAVGTAAFDAPSCPSCHADRTAAHGYASIDHTATIGLQVEVDGKTSCTACHSADLMTEHAKPTSTGPRSCATCHPEPFTTSVKLAGGWDFGCARCHGVASLDPKHSGMAAGHTLSDTPACAGCHDVSDIVALHSNATTMTPSGTFTSCLVCHMPGRPAPVSADCATCHSAEGVDYHAAMTAKHLSPTSNGCFATPGCHAATRSLPDVHAPFVGPGKDYATTCAMCHQNKDPERIDWSVPVDPSCTGTCHGGFVHSQMNHHASSAASQECVACHGSSWVVGVHGADGTTTGDWGACDTCHNQPDGVGDVTYRLTTSDCENCHADHSLASVAHYPTASHEATQGPECGSCHLTGLMPEHTRAAGTAFACLTCHSSDKFKALARPWDRSCDACHGARHSNETTAHASAQTSCSGLNCHDIGDLTVLHSKASTTVAGVAYSGCGVCHRTPVDQPASSDCLTCHAGHGDLTVVHATLVSGACVDCHESSDVRAVHAGSDKGACDVCHDNPDIPTLPATTECVNCHATLSPPDPAHYVEATHTASGVTGDCYKCHELSMMAEHSKPSVSPQVTCVSCHETKVDTFTAPWDKTCAACHASTHGGQAAAHTATASDACAGAGCHAVGDVSAIHAAAVSADGLRNGCCVCHASADALPQSAECSTCHSPHGDTTAAHTAPAGLSCAQCHLPDVRPVHAANALGACDVCHDNAARIGDIRAATAACTSCHALYDTSVSTHTAYATAHVGAQADCAGAGCHAIADLTALHSKATTTVAGITYDGCAVCHRSPTDQPTSSDCTACHAGHGDLTVAHSAVASAECVACHESADVRSIHATKGCASCHGNPAVPALPASVECANCHGSLVPADPNHYPAAAHTASETGCANCHYMELDPEHSKATVSPTVTCVSCHETKVDAFTSAWDKTCAACHPTKHTGMAAKHASSNTACSGTGCHDITDVSDIHKGVVGGGCQVCHTGPASVPTGKTDCLLSGCHASMGTSHHAAHDASTAIDPGCKGCHFTYLDDEHSALGYSCATCHSSTNAAVIAAIAGGVRACGACHPAVNGKDRHAAQASMEFNKDNSSGHRAYSALPFMKTSFAVNGSTYTWAAPTNFLKTGWTTTSMVTCNECHTFATTAIGPHGSSVKVNMDPAYPTDWKSVYLSSGGASSSTFVCAKCHQNFGSMNGVHAEGDHHGSGDGKCIGCHTQVPHGWRLPRLLAYRDDPAPYSSLYLTGIRVKSYTPTNWSESDCSQSGCDEHSSSMSSRWPSAVQAVGALAGTVRSTSSVAIAGATVTTDKGQSATTGATGGYSLANLAPATYSVTYSMTGYTSQTLSVTIAQGETLVKDVALAPVPAASNLALGRTFSASHTYNSTYAAAKAGDGSTSTYWWSGPSSSNEWLKVDMGSSQAVSRVEIAWYGSRHATSYTVQTSTDNSNWTQVYGTSNGTSGTSAITFSSRNARYVRVNLSHAYSSSNGYGIAEMRVFH